MGQVEQEIKQDENLEEDKTHSAMLLVFLDSAMNLPVSNGLRLALLFLLFWKYLLLAVMLLLVGLEGDDNDQKKKIPRGRRNDNAGIHGGGSDEDNWSDDDCGHSDHEDGDDSGCDDREWLSDDVSYTYSDKYSDYTYSAVDGNYCSIDCCNFSTIT